MTSQADLDTKLSFFFRVRFGYDGEIEKYFRYVGTFCLTYHTKARAFETTEGVRFFVAGAGAVYAPNASHDAVLHELNAVGIKFDAESRSEMLDLLHADCSSPYQICGGTKELQPGADRASLLNEVIRRQMTNEIKN